MNAKTSLVTLALVALAAPAEASKQYSGWACRLSESVSSSTPAEYLDEGSFSVPGSGFQLPVAICQIPTDTNEMITQIEVYAQVSSVDQFSEGVFCRAEMRGMSGGVWHQSQTVGTSGLGNQSFTITIPPTAVSHFLQLRCSIGGAKIRAIRVS